MNGSDGQVVSGSIIAYAYEISGQNFTINAGEAAAEDEDELYLGQ